MAVYVITGRLGSGKTLVCVGRIRDALLAGRRVATNLDIDTTRLLPRGHARGELWRVPDHPILSDLEGLGRGTDEVDESRHGLIVLDECGAWLNARTWADKERQRVIDWMLHSRKLGWDVYLIVQHLGMLDKQIRDSMTEYHVICRRMDRYRVPLIGARLPKVHLAFVRYGSAPDSPIVERWMYRGRHLYAAYDTRQRYRPRSAEGALQSPVRVPLPAEIEAEAKRVAQRSWAARWPAHVVEMDADARWALARALWAQSDRSRVACAEATSRMGSSARAAKTVRLQASASAGS